jgi:hypothetical protein
VVTILQTLLLEENEEKKKDKEGNRQGRGDD